MGQQAAAHDEALNLHKSYASRGVRGSVMRLSPMVHGRGDHGFVPMLLGLAREKGVAAFIGAGANPWTSVPRTDAARLFRLALGQAPGGPRLPALSEERLAFPATTAERRDGTACDSP